jgi:DNA-binding NarL/FixJ family response regulator
MSAKPHVAVVEDHSLVRRGLESLVAGSERMVLTVAVSRPNQLARNVHHLDVILYGPPPGYTDGLPDGLSELSGKGKVLLLADFESRLLVTDVLRAGASGCAQRQISDEELLCAVEMVARGAVHVASSLSDRLRKELYEAEFGSLPPMLARREMETLRLLATGLTHSQIARRMNLTEATISTYVKRIRHKLGVGNKADLTRKAIEFGLVEAPGKAPRVLEAVHDQWRPAP